MRDTLPVELEPGERGVLHRLDLLPQLRERSPAQAAKDLGIAPLTPSRPIGVAGSGERGGEEFAAQDALLLLESLEREQDGRRAQTQPPRDVLGPERCVRPRVA